MENIDKIERIYLLMTWNKSEFKTRSSYVKVLKAQIYDDIIEDYPIGILSFIFISKKEHKELYDKLSFRKNSPFMLVELSEPLVSGTLKGFFPETDVELLREITKYSLSLNLDKILDKINRSGIESLNSQEKEFLKAHEDQDQTKQNKEKNGEENRLDCT